MLRKYPTSHCHQQRLGAVLLPLYPVLYVLISTYAHAQQPPAVANADSGDPSAQPVQVTDSDGQNTANDETQNPTEPQTSKPLPTPSQYTYTEAVRDSLISQELGHLRGDIQRIELTGSLHTFPAIWQADLSGEPLGAALIFAPPEVSPTSIQLRNLQYFLALNGWASLTITTLSEDPKPIPPAGPIALPISQAAGTENQESQDEPQADQQNEDVDIDESEVIYQEPENDPTQVATDTNEGADNTTQPDDTEPQAPKTPNSELMVERIALGLGELIRKNYFNNVVIAHDTSANHIANYLLSKGNAGQEIETVQAIVYINIQTNTSERRRELDSITELMRPTLDITNLPYPVVIGAQKERANRAKQLKHPLYITRNIVLGESNTSAENNLTRIVRGFITRHAAGTETQPAD